MLSNFIALQYLKTSEKTIILGLLAKLSNFCKIAFLIRNYVKPDCTSCFPVWAVQYYVPKGALYQQLAYTNFCHLPAYYAFIESLRIFSDSVGLGGVCGQPE